MNRRKFIKNSSALSAGTLIHFATPAVMCKNKMPDAKQKADFSHRLPASDGHYLRTCGYVEDTPITDYTWAPPSTYEDFNDMKFGIRLHWGPYSIGHNQGESWNFLTMSLQERQAYQQLYKQWNPIGFDAEQWTDFFKDSGAKMFSFTTKHHDGFSMYDTKARVKKRVNWLAPGGAVMEDCDIAYSIMETPFKRDVVKELTDAAYKKGLKVDLYFSHPDWYDADFRPYVYHPLQVPGADKISVSGKDLTPVVTEPNKRFGKSGLVIVPQASAEEVKRMMARHRMQLEELITQYGDISMVCLDMFFGPSVWPALRDTMLYLRKIKPGIMYRARGIGNYGDYYTPEGFVPGSKENTDVPWFVIYPLGNSFSYDPVAANHKGAKWIVKNLVDAVAKGGNFMAGIGPDGNGVFHQEAITQLKQTGAWLKLNGEGIYATRPRSSELWKEGDNIRFTRSKNNKTIYVFSYEWPGEQLILKTVHPLQNAKVTFLGFTAPLQWTYDGSVGLVIQLPSEWKEKFSGPTALAYGWEITLE